MVVEGGSSSWCLLSFVLLTVNAIFSDAADDDSAAPADDIADSW